MKKKMDLRCRPRLFLIMVLLFVELLASCKTGLPSFPTTTPAPVAKRQSGTSAAPTALGLPENFELRSLSGTGGKIYLGMTYTADLKKVEETYIVNADGSGVTRLISSLAYAITPSPDWKKLVIKNQWGYFVMNQDGSEQFQLEDCLCFDWSPDGQQIAFLGDAGVEIVHADGSGKVQTLAATSCPNWLINGTITFAYDGTIQWINPDGTGFSALPRITGLWGLDWSPDGKRVAFSTGREIKEGERSDRRLGKLYVMNADGSGKQLLDEDDEANYAALRWSPDGRWIAFQKQPGGMLNAMLADGSEKVEIGYSASGYLTWTPDGNFLGGYAWSPDGKMLAYVGREDQVNLYDLAEKKQQWLIIGTLHAHRFAVFAWAP